MDAARPVEIRWWLAGLVVGVALPLFGLLIWMYGSEVHRESMEARNTALRMARATALQIEAANAEADGLLRRLAARGKTHVFDRSVCESLFSVVDFDPEDENLFLFSNDGALLCSGSPRLETHALSFEVERWIERALRDGSLQPGRPMMGLVNDRWVSVLSLRSEYGTLALMQLPHAFDQTLEPDAVTTIVDRNGAIVARSSKAQDFVGRSGSWALLRLASGKSEGIAEAKGLDGVQRQYGFSAIPRLEWTVYVGIPTSTVMRPARQMFIRGIAGGVAIVVIVAFIATMFWRRIEQPINVMFGVAELRMQDDERKLKALSDRLLVVQEEERTRIARELHDDLGQSLTALKMDVIGMMQSSEQRSPIADRILRTLDATVTAVQRISYELRPSILDDLGLVAAIESEALLFEQRTGIECELSLDNETQIEPHVATGIYRIIQEALTNVARHSNASRVEIRLRQRAEEVLLEVRDDGRGVTHAEVGDPMSLGLVGIRERADLVGGSVEFEGIAGRGTIVSVRIPTPPFARTTP